MYKQIIATFEPEYTQTRLETNLYEIEVNKFPKIVSFLLDKLKKWGWLSITQHIEYDGKLNYNTITYDELYISKYIRRQIEILNIYYHIKPKCIYIGRDHFSKLNIELSGQVIAPLELHEKTLRAFFGVRVILIPWMVGVLAVPRMEEE